VQDLVIFTVGHSAHSYEHFLGLLQAHGISAVADVRTTPFSRHQPHFNGDTLRSELKLDRISYVALGKELGGRPSSQSFYCDGVADYEKMAKTELFERGIERVLEGAAKFQIALMCSEHDPLDCHRCLLVARALFDRRAKINHILGNGDLMSQEQIEEKLLDMAGTADGDLLMSAKERLAIAYRKRARRVAFAEPTANAKAHALNQ
jgi:uncharacterized protein (DUF488 family)